MSTMENSVDKQILFESFSGRSTPVRKQQIEEWLQVPGNVERYYEWLDEWEKANPQYFPDAEAAWKKMMTAGETVSLPVTANRKTIGLSRLFRFRLIAAAIAVIILVTATYSLRNILLYHSMSTGYGETRSVILPDGSLVSMNANSTIRYSRYGFGKADREIFLTGEADFSVTHAGGQPFIVTTGADLHVTVLGTRFTVYAREKQQRVVLREGKVQLSYRGEQPGKKLILQPGDLFTSAAGGNSRLQHISNPENLSAWKDHEFMFDGTSLTEIAAMIRDNFGLSVRFERPGIAERRITGSFHADTAAELLDAFAQLLNIHYTIREGTIYFSE
jgi:ferric-dicitrate binding protein FerR (iron transport regulator)